MDNCPFIDGIPILKMVIFYCYVSHNQMVIFNVLEQIQVDDDGGPQKSWAWKFAIKNINGSMYHG